MRRTISKSWLAKSPSAIASTPVVHTKTRADLLLLLLHRRLHVLDVVLHGNRLVTIGRSPVL